MIMYYIKSECNICESVIRCWNGFKSWWEAKFWITQRAKVKNLLLKSHSHAMQGLIRWPGSRSENMFSRALCSSAGCVVELIKFEPPQTRAPFSSHSGLMKFRSFYTPCQVPSTSTLYTNTPSEHTFTESAYTTQSVIRIWYYIILCKQ